MSTALLGGKKMVLFFFFLFPGQTTACPDMLSALGIGSGMCIGLLTETYTKYLSTGYLSETFPASVLVKRPWTIVFLKRHCFMSEWFIKHTQAVKVYSCFCSEKNKC